MITSIRTILGERFINGIKKYLNQHSKDYHGGINQPVKIYKALLSQNAPVATVTDPTMIAGQIWTLDAYNAADAATIASLELVSGTLNALGSKYRSATDQTLNVNVATTLSYDGAPYVVSSNSDDTFTPLINTIGEIVWTRNDVGIFIGTLTGAFTANKTFFGIGSYIGTPSTNIFFRVDTDNIRIETVLHTSGDPDDDLLDHTSVEIEVYS